MLDEYTVIRTEVIPCTTDQWNFPHDRARPWVSDAGECSVCTQLVEHERLSPQRAYAYTCIAQPHTRTVRWYEIREDELIALYFNLKS